MPPLIYVVLGENIYQHDTYLIGAYLDKDKALSVAGQLMTKRDSIYVRSVEVDSKTKRETWSYEFGEPVHYSIWPLKE